MEHKTAAEEVRWHTINIYVDVETGEKITLEEAKKSYVIVNKKKHSHVQHSTGTTTITNECKRSSQGKLFD